MKHGARMLLSALAGLALCLAAQASANESSDSPYQGIVDRNVFGLKPPPAPKDPEPAKPPPPKILLTGITTILGSKRALMKMTPPAKPGEPAKEQSFTLGEGQRDGELEVVEIDEKAGKVKVNNYGTAMDLDWENNGIKTAAAPAPAGAAPRPAGLPPGFPPSAAPHPFTPAGSAPPSPTVRQLRLPTPAGAGASAVPQSVTPVYATATPTVQTPTSAQTAAAAAAGQLTADQRFLMVEAYRAKLKQEGTDRLLPPIPPTPFTRDLNPDPAPDPTPTPTPVPTMPTLPRAPSLPPIPAAQ